MNDDSLEFPNNLPLPLLDFVKSMKRLPESMTKAKTFYEAARIASQTPWVRALDEFSALNTWSMLALIADERTRHYMAKIITDKDVIFTWIIDAGKATREAMLELSRSKNVSPGRLLKQRQVKTLRALGIVRENLVFLNFDFSLRNLLVGKDFDAFSMVLDRFVHSIVGQRVRASRKARAEAIARGEPPHEIDGQSMLAFIIGKNINKLPTLDNLLESAEIAVRKIPKPSSDRHNARSQYLREMFTAVKDTPIASRRIAFLSHASEAVFGEPIEKRDVRRLVADLVEDERENAQSLKLFEDRTWEK